MSANDAGRATVLTGGTVLTCDPSTPDLLIGDVRIEGGRITDIGPLLPRHPTDRVIDVSGAIVLPGLVDAHQHLWEAPYALQHPDLGLPQYFAEFVRGAAGDVRPEQLHDTVRTALAAALQQGVTTTFDWCHATNTPDHATASVEAGLRSGARYIFGYGPPVALGYYRSDRPHPAELGDLAASVGTSSLVRIAAALRGPDLSPWNTCLDDIRRARESGVVVSMHIGTRSSGPGGIQSLADHGMLGPDLHVVHATDSTASELRALADAGATLVVPPIAELMMGTGAPPMRSAVAVDLPVALGVDTVLGTPAGLFEQMRAALLSLRDAEWQGWQPPMGSLCRDVLSAATLNGARACGLADETGSLTIGKSADLIVMDAPASPRSLDQAYAQVVWTGHATKIRSVLVAGRHVAGTQPSQDKNTTTEELSL